MDDPNTTFREFWKKKQEARKLTAPPLEVAAILGAEPVLFGEDHDWYAETRAKFAAVIKPEDCVIWVFVDDFAYYTAEILRGRRHKIAGWRRHRAIFGNPDFIFPHAKLAVFVDGCFWHACPKHGTQPASNRAFWKRKLTRNKSRDRLVNRTLRARGWSVLRIWQHELTRKNESRLLRRIRRTLRLV